MRKDLFGCMLILTVLERGLDHTSTHLVPLQPKMRLDLILSLSKVQQYKAEKMVNYKVLTERERCYDQ